MDNSGVANKMDVLKWLLTVPVLTVEQMFCVGQLTHSLCVGSAFTSMQ